MSKQDEEVFAEHHHIFDDAMVKLLSKIRPVIEKQERERVVDYLIELLEADSKTVLVYAIEQLQLKIQKEEALKEETDES